METMLPIRLHEVLELTEDDVEKNLGVNEFPTDTRLFKCKDGFPSYSINTETRTLIIILNDPLAYVAFLLKEDSTLLQGYKERYEPWSA